MKKPQEKTQKYSAKQVKQLHDNTDYKKLDQLSDQTINYRDIPETDETFWASAKVYDPGAKKAISIRIDQDVLQWFKQQKGRYQRLINHVLRQYMNTHR